MAHSGPMLRGSSGGQKRSNTTKIPTPARSSSSTPSLGSIATPLRERKAVEEEAFRNITTAAMDAGITIPDTIIISTSRPDKFIDWAKSEHLKKISLLVVNEEGKVVKEGFHRFYGYLPTNGDLSFPILLSRLVKHSAAAINNGPGRYIFKVPSDYARHSLVFRNDEKMPVAEVEKADGTDEWILCVSPDTTVVRPVTKKRGDTFYLEFIQTSLSPIVHFRSHVSHIAAHPATAPSDPQEETSTLHPPRPPTMRFSVKALLELYQEFIESGGGHDDGEGFSKFALRERWIPCGEAERVLTKIGKQKYSTDSSSPSHIPPVVAVLRDHLEEDPQCCCSPHGGDVAFNTLRELWDHLKSKIFANRTTTKRGRARKQQGQPEPHR